MYTIRILSRYEYSWITTENIHNLFSQLTDSTLLTQKEFETWYKEIHKSPYFVLFGITTNNTLVGIGSLWIEKKYYKGKSGHIEDIIIDKNHQNQGLGKKLITFITNVAKERGCYKVQLHCKPELQGFYEKLDFKNDTCSMQLYF